MKNESKTYLELEQIGIVGVYREDMVLYIITKGGDVWRYNSVSKDFNFVRNLME